jgi:hypothetical protein
VPCYLSGTDLKKDAVYADIIVQATYLVFQANTFFLLIKPRDGKFPI